MVECKQEHRITRNEVILDGHSSMLPELAAGMTRIAADLKAIKWCAIGCAAGYILNETGVIGALKIILSH